MYSVPFLTNDHGEFVLWFFTGSKCNLKCTHCYIDCGPEADEHPFLTLDTFRKRLEEGVKMGHKKLEIYFTGGEPFINPDLLTMFRESLEHADTTVLTNATRISKEQASEIKHMEEKSAYNFHFRISLDGPDAASNDKIRGHRAFERAERGIKHIINAGFNPIITSMRSWSILNSMKMEEKFSGLIKDFGIEPELQQLKILPPLRIGREIDRDRPYREDELFTSECFDDYDYNDLQCSKCRMVTERGVWVCPILVNDDNAKMADDLEGSAHAYKMKQTACWTCRMEGMSCEN